jgi:RimJ/RimL family protein N-acetyltransferase
MTRLRLRLETERLRLVPFTAELIDALAERAHAQRLLGAAIPDGWPDEELAGLLSLYRDWIRADPSLLGFGPWVVLVGDVVVGSAGFLGKADDTSTIELGFGTHPDHRDRGYASEAARTLVGWGLAQPGVERVIARCEPENSPSVRVLEKIGMQPVGEVGGQLLWETRTGCARA